MHLHCLLSYLFFFSSNAIAILALPTLYSRDQVADGLKFFIFAEHGKYGPGDQGQMVCTAKQYKVIEDTIMDMRVMIYGAQKLYGKYLQNEQFDDGDVRAWDMVRDDHRVGLRTARTTELWNPLAAALSVKVLKTTDLLPKYASEHGVFVIVCDDQLEARAKGHAIKIEETTDHRHTPAVTYNYITLGPRFFKSELTGYRVKDAAEAIQKLRLNDPLPTRRTSAFVFLNFILGAQEIWDVLRQTHPQALKKALREALGDYYIDQLSGKRLQEKTNPYDFVSSLPFENDSRLLHVQPRRDYAMSHAMLAILACHALSEDQLNGKGLNTIRPDKERKNWKEPRPDILPPAPMPPSPKKSDWYRKAHGTTPQN